jgi:hypothetical protein
MKLLLGAILGFSILLLPSIMLQTSQGSEWDQKLVPEANVEIQIYKDGKPVYFAQTNVKSDGSYEQYFRVKSVEGDKVIHIFEGDYTVNIYKYVVKSTAPGTST